MDEIPEAKIVVEGQVLETLAKIRQALVSGLTIKFEETHEPQLDPCVSYWGEALVELIGAYVKSPKIALLVWVKHWDFHERATEEFWSLLSQRVYEELTSRVPDLKWFSLEVQFLDLIEHLEEAAFLSENFP